jgi:hypothetical protein
MKTTTRNLITLLKSVMMNKKMLAQSYGSVFEGKKTVSQA